MPAATRRISLLRVFVSCFIVVVGSSAQINYKVAAGIDPDVVPGDRRVSP